MICPYCQENEGTKKNTHYLSDNVIRTALNAEGSKKREKGFYFDMSNNSGAIKFNFQRATPQEILKGGLGRQPSEQEIEDAKTIPFSVDDVFCPACEELFTAIENQFTEAILPQLRDSDLSETQEITFSEFNIIRKYFYLQLWRSSICDETFQLANETQNELRIILRNDNVENEELCKFPLSITYLNTIGGQEKYTQNVVGFTDDQNPYVIFMNDFIIQFYDNEESVKYFDLHNLNNEGDYVKYINLNKDEFIVKVLSDKKRIEFNLDIMKESKSTPLISMLKDNFTRMYFAIFRTEPSQEQIDQYLASIIGGEQELALKYSYEELRDRTIDYLKGLLMK